MIDALNMLVRAIGIDLGTVTTRGCVPGRGVIIDEPTVVAVSLDENRILAVGNEAREMIGRTPDEVRAIRPVREGVVADYGTSEAFLKSCIRRALGRVRDRKSTRLNSSHMSIS